MPDLDPLPPSPAAKRPHLYSNETPTATLALDEILRDRITRHGALRFADFMATALYDPVHGYYARGTRQVGRGGDFFTSVSVGPLFGEVLARRFLRHWQESATPPRWRIIESGAHDGTLAADLLTAMAALDPLAYATLEYVIPEPLPVLQAAQRTTLASHLDRVRFIHHPRELADDPLPGVAFGNELLDALPCHLVEWQGDHWQECRVAVAADGRLIWQLHAIDDPLLLAALAPLDALGNRFPTGYRTEVRTHFHEVLAPLARALSSGLMLWADYGFARPDYYHPDRTAGTLRTFSGHQAAANPLDQPGLTDITAHVDFTAVAEAAIALGGRPTEFRNQGSWITATARSWLLEQEGRPHPSFIRQFQTLTHPAHLGGCFHILELSWNPQATAADAPALAHRLF